MRLVTYSVGPGGPARAGVRVGHRVLDVEAASRVKGEPLPPFDTDGSAAKQESAAPAPASADAEGETFKLEAEPSQDGGTGEKTQDETKQQ